MLHQTFSNTLKGKRNIKTLILRVQGEKCLSAFRKETFRRKLVFNRVSFGLAECERVPVAPPTCIKHFEEGVIGSSPCSSTKLNGS